MTPPTVDRFRYPWRRVVPGEPHTVRVIRRVPVDLSGRDFELVMVDAFTSTPVLDVVYVADMTDAATGVVVMVADVPADIDTSGQYELRFRDLTADETLIAGPVVFKPSVIPVGP